MSEPPGLHPHPSRRIRIPRSVFTYRTLHHASKKKKKTKLTKRGKGKRQEPRRATTRGGEGAEQRRAARSGGQGEGDLKPDLCDSRRPWARRIALGNPCDSRRPRARRTALGGGGHAGRIGQRSSDNGGVEANAVSAATHALITKQGV